MATASKENYIKTIYQYQREGSNISTSEIAEELEVTNAATSGMAKKLSQEGLISYTKYKGIELTEKGETLALQVIRRHRLWELFLNKVLGLSWGELHEEAERLEHSTSDFLINKIEDYLDFPQFDPHGDPIPDRNGVMPDLPEFIKLNDCVIKKTYRIARVNDRNSELMEYLIKIGLILNKKFKVVQKLSFDNSIIISLDGNEYSLSDKIANNIYAVAV